MNENRQDDRPVLSIIQDLKSGVLVPEKLDKSTRQSCVEVLAGEGYSCIQIAQIIKRTDRTIRRDLEDIRRKNALSPDLEYAKQFIGEVVVTARNHHSHLMRLARSPDATVVEKIQGELAAWKVIKEVIEKLQALGYLPLKPQEIYGHFFNQPDPDTAEDMNAMKKQISELEEQAKEMGVFDEEVSKNILLLQEDLKQSEIKSKISDLKTQLDKKEGHDED